MLPTRPTRSFGVISQLRPSNNTLGPKRFPAAESAFFYVAGGTTNDADALTTVYQILH